MALCKRGSVWHYDFRFEGVWYQGSTRQSNKREAQQVLSALKADLARRRVNLPPLHDWPISTIRGVDGSLSKRRHNPSGRI